jgi:hemolysin activation/secretion protein
LKSAYRIAAILVALLVAAVPTAMPAYAQTIDEEIILDGDVEDAVPEEEDGAPDTDAGGAAEEAEAAPEDDGQGEPPQTGQAPPAAAAPGDGARQPRAVVSRIVLRTIAFSPSEYLSDAELDAVRQGFLGRSVALADLGGLVGVVDALYRDRGILLARAVPSRIDVSQGRVSIELQEARIGRITSSGADHISQRYIAYRLGMAEGDLADNRLVDERVLRLSLTDGMPIEAEFSAGAMPGIVDLGLTLSRQKPVSVFASVDTFGKEATGVMRGTAGLTIHSLTGWNDPLSLSGTVTEGSLSGSVGYSRAVHPLGTRLSVAADASSSQTLAAPVTRNQSYGVEVGLAHPFVVRPDMRLQASVSAIGFAETGTIRGAPLVDQHGYGGRLGASQIFNGQGWFAAFGQTVTGIGWYDGIVGGARIDHVALGGNAAGAIGLGAHHSFAVQVVGQLALNARAPAKYRLTVAGPSGVRGYDQDVSSGDSGVYLRAQLERLSPLPIGIDHVDVRPFAFADVVQASVSAPPWRSASTCSVTSMSPSRCSMPTASPRATSMKCAAACPCATDVRVRE